MRPGPPLGVYPTVILSYVFTPAPFCSISLRRSTAALGKVAVF